MYFGVAAAVLLWRGLTVHHIIIGTSGWNNFIANFINWQCPQSSCCSTFLTCSLSFQFAECCVHVYIVTANIYVTG
jgi:hypothetical protein